MQLNQNYQMERNEFKIGFEKKYEKGENNEKTNNEKKGQNEQKQNNKNEIITKNEIDDEIMNKNDYKKKDEISLREKQGNKLSQNQKYKHEININENKVDTNKFKNHKVASNHSAKVIIKTTQKEDNLKDDIKQRDGLDEKSKNKIINTRANQNQQKFVRSIDKHVKPNTLLMFDYHQNYELKSNSNLRIEDQGHKKDNQENQDWKINQRSFEIHRYYKQSTDNHQTNQNHVHFKTNDPNKHQNESELSNNVELHIDTNNIKNNSGSVIQKSQNRKKSEESSNKQSSNAKHMSVELICDNCVNKHLLESKKRNLNQILKQAEIDKTLQNN